jgi:hypothetical protein
MANKPEHACLQAYLSYEMPVSGISLIMNALFVLVEVKPRITFILNQAFII